MKAFYNPHGVLHGATTNQVFLLPVVLDKVSLFAFNPCSGQACTSQQLHYMFARRRHVYLINPSSLHRRFCRNPRMDPTCFSTASLLGRSWKDVLGSFYATGRDPFQIQLHRTKEVDHRTKTIQQRLKNPIEYPSSVPQ